MKKKLALMLAFFMVSFLTAYAQSTLTGKVISADDNEPVIGASVLVKGTKIGTATDIDGKFVLNGVPAGNHTLVVSYVGMVTKTVQAKNGMTISLQSDGKALDEVVVVAYGTARKTSLTGAIQEIKADKIENRVTSSVASALEGSVSGVQVNSTYGAPGGDPSIRIRGIGTVNGSSSPLYVLDGVPYDGNISDLNPADIESMSVLKDAASAALYGNRASNGVILITTKKGKSGSLKMSLDIKQGSYNRGIKEYARVNAKEFMEVEYQNMKNAYMTTKSVDAATAGNYAANNLIAERLKLNIFNKKSTELFDVNGKLVSDAQILEGYVGDLDWYDEAIRSGYRQEYNLNATGGTDKADYMFSIGYLDENGYVKDSGYDRISARVVLNAQPKKWLKVGVNLSGTHQNFDNTNGDSDASYTNAFMYCRSIAPIYPVHTHDVNTGEYILDGNGNKIYDSGSYEKDGAIFQTRPQYVDRHVIWENELNSDKSVRNTLNTIAYANIYLPYNFTATVKGNLNVRNSQNETYSNAQIGDGKGNNGRASLSDYRYKNYTFQQQLAWNNTFGKHEVDALIGHENYYYNRAYHYAYKTEETFAGKPFFSNFNTPTSVDGYSSNYRTESYLARARYAYDNTYNAEFSFRRDGSSRFSKDARWGNFWSIGGNWIVSNEAFMKDIKAVDFLKLRADYGEVGNDAGAGYYGYMALYSSETNANKGSYYLGQNPNNDLKWETGQSWGIGIDAKLFGRWNLSVEYFDKRNKDLLFDVYLPLSAGATASSAAEATVTKNLGVIANRGWEISTDVDVYKNSNWKVNVGANVSVIKNKVLTLPEQNKDGIIDGTKKIVEGKDRYTFYLYTWEGVDMMTGNSAYKFNDEEYQIKYTDAAGDHVIGENKKGVLTDADFFVVDGKPYVYSTTYAKKEFHGSALPKFYGSFNFNVSYKALSLSALFTYQVGGKIIDYNYQSLMSAGTSPAAYHQDILKSWSTADATAEHVVDANAIPQVNNAYTYNNSTSSRFLVDASYLALKNLTLSYQLPKSLTKKIDLEGVGFTASCENLFTATARQGLNPQQSFGGTQYNYLVTPRVFSVGVNVKF